MSMEVQHAPTAAGWDCAILQLEAYSVMVERAPGASLAGSALAESAKREREVIRQSLCALDDR